MKTIVQNEIKSLVVLGGKPAFASAIPITKPTVPPIDGILNSYERILKSGMLTNAGYVKEFEFKVAEYLGVKHAIAVNSCTSGLMLCMRALGLKGEVILPSFTFHATAHAAVWNQLALRFVNCDLTTFNIDLDEVEAAITKKTTAILATHIFGNPNNINGLQRIAKKHKLKLIFDAAHGFGSRYKGKNLGSFGNAEVFSLSPTKLLTSAEGGIVATQDDNLAKNIRTGRNYGDSGTYDSEFSGLSSRMSEFHAALGIESLKTLEANVANRAKMVTVYKELLQQIPGISFQIIDGDCRSSYKDFCVVINEKVFGLGRDQLAEILKNENIIVKKYFDPPCHLQQAFKQHVSKKESIALRKTVRLAEQVLSLPLFSHIDEETVRRICAVLSFIYDHRLELKGKI